MKYMAKNKSKFYLEKNRNQEIKDLRYFREDLSEFDSPDEKGSGKKYMDLSFVKRLDQARHFAGIPFIITSGYRSIKHNEKVKGVMNSCHCEIPCKAADILTSNSHSRYRIIRSLMDVGFTRFGIGENFIHVDSTVSKKKAHELIWDYY